VRHKGQPWPVPLDQLSLLKIGRIADKLGWIIRILWIFRVPTQTEYISAYRQIKIVFINFSNSANVPSTGAPNLANPVTERLRSGLRGGRIADEFS